MVGNRLPRGRTVLSGKPGNRAPATLATVRADAVAANAQAQVETASVQAEVTEVASGIPPDLTSAVDDLNALALDFEARIAALEAPP